ncbi:3'-5' exonuclease, partial [uncultured Muribaculum sp.]
ALERAFVDDTPDELAMEAADMTCINLPSLVERIIGRYVDADTLSRENVYVCAFQDMVIDFCSHADADIHSFIKWWDATGSSSKLSTPASLDAIKVMTIHKSKGLEFPCVHIPFCGLPHNRQSDIAWFGTRNAEGSLIDDFVRDGFDKDCVPPFVPLSVGKALEGTMFDSRYKEIVSEKYVDRLNLLYVACTRAVNELMFYYTPVKKIKTEQLDGTSLPTTDFLLANAFSVADAAFCSNNEPLPGLLAPLKNHVDSCDLFEFGEAVDHKAEERKEPMVEMPAYYSYDNEGIWEMSRIEDLEDMERPRRRGIVLHSIMSGVRNRSDVERAVRRRAARGFIDDDEIDGYIAELSDALSDERVDEWFEGYRRLLRESTIAVPTGDGVRNYRPDRVVWTSQGTIDVIDYKFGEEEPSGYIRQVKGYMRLISKIYPDVEVRGFLWYPLQKRITRV